MTGTSLTLAELSLPGVVTKTAWQLPEGMSLPDWLTLGRQLVRVEKSVQWLLGYWWAYGASRNYGDGRELATQVGIDYGLICNYASVVRRVEISERSENLSFGHHEAVAALPRPEQRQWLERAKQEVLSVAKLKLAIRRQAAIDRTTEVAFDANKLGKFAVIYADPPWQYESPTGNRAIEIKYPTLTLAEICALPVAEIAHDDGVLFLWVPPRILEQAFEVIGAWGFSYRTGMVWAKDKIGAGFWVRQRHEILLIARRGEMPVPPPEARPDSVFEAPRLEHSAKPPVVYDLTDRMFPDVRKIELFARHARPGWDAWGNEAPPPVAAEAAE
jgi:N6-adenosine-specific RNA methylase IME4